MLRAHNDVRARVGVRPLTWSVGLARYSQLWADRLANENRIYHHAHPVYGENLYLIAGGRTNAADVVDSWASEAKDYDYRSNTCASSCGHYTQIVWRHTQQVGCAVSQSGEVQVWVCEYNPPGNYIGERPY